MRHLAKIIAPAVLASLAFGALPAQAATPGRANAIRVQIDQLQRTVARNDWRGRISDREAAGIRRDIRQLQWQFRDFNRNGLNQREMTILEQRIRAVRAELRMERRDRDHHRW